MFSPLSIYHPPAFLGNTCAFQTENNVLCTVPLIGLNPVFYAEDHAIGLSTFTIMAGLGGSLGYAMGALNWGWLGNHQFYYHSLGH